MKREAKIREIFAISDEDSDDDIGHKEEEFVESLLARPSVLIIPTWSVAFQKENTRKKGQKSFLAITFGRNQGCSPYPTAPRSF